MESNMIEATRAKHIAEKRMQSKDFVGAQKLASKAHFLYPGLENISQILTICEVHASAQLDFTGSEMDWYGILQVSKIADQSSIEEHYQKLSLLLDPNKNRFAGAESAFALVKEAYCVLSDPEKRSMYDVRRLTRIGNVNSCAQEQVGAGNELNNCSTSHYQGASQQRRQQPQIPPTFWTICLLCNVRHRCERAFLYRCIQCKNCKQHFVAYDMNYEGPMKAKSVCTQTGPSGVSSGCQRKASTDGDGIRSAKTKNKHVEMNRRGQSSSGKMVRKRRKITMESSESCNSDSTDIEYVVEYNADTQKDGATCSRYPLRSKHIQDATNEGNGSGHDGIIKCLEYKRLKMELSSNGADRERNGESSNGALSTFTADPETQSTLEFSIYPDPEFHDFDKDRMQNLIRVGQIWAVYDDVDVLPRFYVLIRKTYFTEPKVQIAWLEPNPQDQHGLDWVTKELPVACGHFRIGCTEDTENLRMFSHLASSEKGEIRGTFNIYPRKGDVWALFKHWSADWSSNLDRHRKVEYEFVEVLSGYVEGIGVVVAFLAMVEGFISLFERREDMEKNHFIIPSSELLRFSHRVPCYRMPGYLELDPASVYSKDFSPKGVNNILEGGTDIQSNSLCFKSVFEMDTSTTRVGFEEKNIQNDEKVDDGRWSVIDMDGTCRSSLQENASQHEAEEGSEGKCLLGEHGSLDVVPNNKPGEPSLTEFQAERASRTHPNDTSEGNSSPSTVSPVRFPTPAFHGFKSEKSEDKFQEGQIWAVYGGDNGSLPTYYAQIKKVELPKFIVHAARLDPCPSFEKDILWSKNGLPIGCGPFKLRTGETKIIEAVSTFSHQVRVVSLPETDRYYIWPWTGEVWAVYKNWSTEWTAADVKQCEYELVEIINFDSSVYKVLILEVVNGFKNIYKGAGITIDIMWHELLRFSHRVPSVLLTEEGGGCLAGYLELDPAALPDFKQDELYERDETGKRGSENQLGGSSLAIPVATSSTSRQEVNQNFERPTSQCMWQDCVMSSASGERAREGQQGSTPEKPVETSCRTEQAEFNQTFEWPTSPSLRHDRCISLAGERSASEGQQGENVLLKLDGTSYKTKEAQLDKFLDWPTRGNDCAIRPVVDITNESTALSRALSPEVAKDSQCFVEWAQQGFLEVGCPAEPAELEGVGDEHGKVWVQRYPKLFALFKPRPHYGTIMGVSDCFLGLIRSSLWETFANFVKKVAHIDWRISDSQAPNLTDQLKALEEAGFPVNILRNHLKASTLKAQQRAIVARATFEALETAKAASPSTECLEDVASAAEIEVLRIKSALAEARRKHKAAKSQLMELREQKAIMEKEIELARHELEEAESHSLINFCDDNTLMLPCISNNPDSNSNL